MYKMYTCSYDEFAKGNQGTFFTRHENLDTIENILSRITTPNDYARLDYPDGTIHWYHDGQIIDYNNELKMVRTNILNNMKTIKGIW